MCPLFRCAHCVYLHTICLHEYGARTSLKNESFIDSEIFWFLADCVADVYDCVNKKMRVERKIYLVFHEYREQFWISILLK